MTEVQRRKYPSLNLEQAIERARVLHERERLNAAPVDLVARHWGFKSITTGPASTAYSAVKQFGLIDETGSGEQRKASISQRARAILTAPDPVREQAIQAAALEPAINRQIWERYGADTPSAESFRWHLISEMGFSDTGAREFAKQYEATIRFAHLADARPQDTVPVDAADEPSASVREGDWPGSGDLSQTSKQDTGHAEPSDLTAKTGSGGAPRSSRHAIPLLGGKQVVLEGEFPLSEAAWQGFMAVLAAFKPGLVEQEGVRVTPVEGPGGT